TSTPAVAAWRDRSATRRSITRYRGRSASSGCFRQFGRQVLMILLSRLGFRAGSRLSISRGGKRCIRRSCWHRCANRRRLDGVFKPLDKVELNENQRVRLHFAPAPKKDVLAWLERIEEHHREFLERHGGPLPDSTPDIAEDRMRDV